MADSMTLARRRLILSLALASSLFLAYALTLTGVVRSADELWIVDATETVATGGDYQLNQTLYMQQVVGVEPIMPIAAAPIYWLTQKADWIGNMHGLALFNPLITALTALLVFHYALTLGYGERTALAAGLLFGLTTMAVPYAQSYFREPLTGLNLLAAAYAWERWRRSVLADSPRRWAWFGAALTLTVVAMLSKESALIFLPMFALIAFPGLGAVRKQARQLGLAAAAIALVAALTTLGLFAAQEAGGLPQRYAFFQQAQIFVEGLPLAANGLLGYFVSPGKAIWWYSPILLLALASPALLPLARWRESWLMLATTLWFGFVYAANKGDLWFGGAGWGARFMLPALPFLMIGALAALDRCLESPRLWPKLIVILLGLAGLIVQIGGVAVNIYSYYNYYERTVGEVTWRGPAIWDFRWSQAIGSLLFLPEAKTDIVWLLPNPDWLMIGLLGAGIVVTLAVALALHRSEKPSELAATLGALSPAIALAIVLFGLSRVFQDSRYLADNPALWQMKADLERNVSANDTIMLSTDQYGLFFLNYYKGRAIWYNLPNSPGERFSPEQPPAVVSDNLEDLIAPKLVEVFSAVSEGGERYHARPVWLVVDTGPFLPWSTRPPERYLARNSYTISVTEYDPRVRLVGYLPRQAPTSLEPERLVDATYGSSIRLLGYDVWASGGEPERLEAGEMLGISLLWEADEPVEADYTVALHVIDSNGQVVAQQDRQPEGGFRPTSSWKAGERLRDNYGFVMPDLPPGKYSIRVTLYSWPSLERLMVTDSQSRALGDSFGLFSLEVR